MVAALAVLAVTACDNSVRLTGATDDGETFKGVAIGTGFADQSGTMQLVSDRGLNCVGTYVFEGVSGPKGTASFNCSNGAAGEATLDMNRRSGDGTLGGRRITLRW